MKYLLWAIFNIAALSNLQSQTPVSFQYDASGNPINGYLDDLSYQPHDPVRITHNSDSYESGLIYNLDGEKTAGLIKYQNNKISFKPSKIDKAKNLRPDDLTGLTIGIDSFCVVSNFYYKGILRAKKHFAQYLDEINGDQFVKFYKFTNFGTSPSLEVTYLAKKSGTDIWHELSGNSLKEHGGKYFDLVQDFNIRLKEGEFKNTRAVDWLNDSFYNYPFGKEPLEPIKEGKVFALIKELEYLNKYAKGDVIYFDAHWNELNKPNETLRTGKIIDITDEFWEIHYYVANEKKYEVKYSSLFPHKKQGSFKSFDKGSLIKEVIYEDNKPTSVVVNYTDEKLYEYKLVPVKDNYDMVVRNDRTFSYVKDENGDNLLEDNQTKVITVTDPLTDMTYTNTYNDGILDVSYRTRNEQKIYQIVDIYDKVNLKRVQKRIISWFDTDRLNKTLTENAQGTVMVKLLIKPDGYVESFKIFGSIHPEFDNMLKTFIEKNLAEGAEYRIKFKPFKVDREKVFLETYIPFVFTINKFYRPPSNYHYNWNMQHMQMINQQMMQQNFINNIQAPTFNPPSF